MSIVQLFNRERKSRADSPNCNRIHMEAYKDAILAFALFYPGGRISQHGGHRTVFWYGGSASLAGGVSRRRADRLHAVRAALFPADSGPERKIQHPAIRHGRLASASSNCSTSRCPRRHRRDATRSGIVRAAKSNSATCGSLITAARSRTTKTGCLRDVSFHIEPGQTLAIVGHTGAGKTTLIQLLLRFYEIQRGQILLDGVDIRESTCTNCAGNSASSCRTRSCLPARSNRTSAWAPKTSTAARVERALREVGLGSLLDSLPEGVEPGQRARLDFFRGPAATDQLRARARAQSALPDPGRSHFERGHQNRNA